MFFGPTCENSLMPALLQASIPALPPSLRMKRFLPFPLDTASTVRLLPGFSAMDPVQQAVLHHTLGPPPTPRRKHASCSVCQMRFNSQSQALAHLKGTKHARKLKALDGPGTKLRGSGLSRDAANTEDSSASRVPSVSEGTGGDQEGSCSIGAASPPGLAPFNLPPVLKEPRPSAPSLTLPTPSLAPAPSPLPRSTSSETSRGEGEEEEEEKARRLLYCSLCKVAVNSASQLDAHTSGTKHKTMLEARTGGGSIRSFPRHGLRAKMASKSTGLQNKTFHCQTCDVHVNSDTQLKQHISSRRHKDRVAGKPAKHKYAPYSKAPKGPGQQAVNLSLAKDQQPLPAQIIPAHLAAMAAAAASAAHRTGHAHAPGHAPSPSGLFQTRSLSAALLRPAPGPIRNSHSQLLFAPY